MWTALTLDFKIYLHAYEGFACMQYTYCIPPHTHQNVIQHSAWATDELGLYEDRDQRQDGN